VPKELFRYSNTRNSFKILNFVSSFWPCDLNPVRSAFKGVTGSGKVLYADVDGYYHVVTN